MEILLDAVEARVLGALIEKDLTTPEYYPLSLNALTNACNQKTNREPVTNYDDATVAAAIERLRSERMAAAVTGAGSRVEKYAHRLADNFNFSERELAILAVLLLRGPQTPGELRQRADRMHSFDDLEAVEVDAEPTDRARSRSAGDATAARAGNQGSPLRSPVLGRRLSRRPAARAAAARIASPAWQPSSPRCASELAN